MAKAPTKSPTKVKLIPKRRCRSAPTNAKAPNMKRASMKPMAIARPRCAQHGRVVCDKAARAGRRGVPSMRNRIAEEFDQQSNRRNSKERGKEKEHVAPSEQIAEDTASGLTEQLAENLPRQKRAEHLLTTFVRNDVTEESQRLRDDPAGRQAARKARSDERRQRPCEPTHQHQHGRHRGR